MTGEYSTFRRIFWNIRVMVNFECYFTIWNDDCEKNVKVLKKEFSIILKERRYRFKNLLLDWSHNNYILLCLFCFIKMQLNSNFLLSKVIGSKGHLLQNAFCIFAVATSLGKNPYSGRKCVHMAPQPKSQQHGGCCLVICLATIEHAKEGEGSESISHEKFLFLHTVSLSPPGISKLLGNQIGTFSW